MLIIQMVVMIDRSKSEYDDGASDRDGDGGDDDDSGNDHDDDDDDIIQN